MVCRRLSRLIVLTFIATLIVPSVWRHPVIHAQQQTKRLILKDGSYQPAVKYEVQGDRVHYLSAERYDWEEIPTSLINWDATRKYEADLSAGKLRVHLAETPEEKEEREKEEANSPEISPGLRLPGTGGVFLLDTYNGKPELAEILQNGGEINKSTSKNVLRAAINPLASAKQAIEIKGTHAQIQAHSPNPTLYVDIDEGSNENPATNRFRIVRADARKDVRVIGNLKIAITGKMSQESNFLETHVEKLGKGDWVKVTPARPLAPGEYAIVEMLGPQEMNLYVWDFGVNPNAVENPNLWKGTATPLKKNGEK